MLNALKEKIFSLIYPATCIFCQKVIPHGDEVCESCKRSIKSSAFCRIVSDDFGSTTYCISPFKYKSVVKSAVWRFKFRSAKNYAKYFADVICSELRKSNEKLDFDCVSAVPLCKIRLKERGYNQAECLARFIAKNLEITYEHTLVKTKNNSVQHELVLSERIKNVKGIYELGANVSGKKILLCDDIITSGNTLKECVNVLRLGGARHIMCCTIACTDQKSHS